MPYRAEIAFVAARDFEYVPGEVIKRGEEITFVGARNDDRLAESSLVRRDVYYICEECGAKFPTLVSLHNHPHSRRKKSQEDEGQQ